MSSLPAMAQDDGVSSEDSNLGCLLQDGRILGLFRESDHQFSNFISPMTNPIYFEDPRTLTEARGIFINHHLPNSLGGDNVQVYATQLRAALTENLSIIATKDGYIDSQSPVLSDGFADVMAGLKYNLFKDAETQSILSTGLTYELPVGSTRALQGRGDGEFHLFLTGGTEFLPNWHWVSGSGFRLPANMAAGNQMWYWSNHVDRKLGDLPFYLFTEANWYHYMSNGTAFPAPIGGLDLFNFGSPGIAGNDVVTGAWGLKYKPNKHVEAGIAYEIPLSSRRDIIQDRLTVDLILRF
ncbi:MAG: hypothetical protein U0872_14335 [Planctomycetaceae bacterium]